MRIDNLSKILTNTNTNEFANIDVDRPAASPPARRAATMPVRRSAAPVAVLAAAVAVLALAGAASAASLNATANATDCNHEPVGRPRWGCRGAREGAGLTLDARCRPAGVGQVPEDL